MIDKIPIPDTVDAFDIGSFKYEVVLMLNRIADHLNKQEQENNDGKRD